MIVYGGTIANYGEIQVKEMKGKSLKTAGVFYAPKYNYEINEYTLYSADLKNDGTISLTDCETEKDIECYAFNTAYLAANHYDITAVNTADITVSSCKGSNIMVMTFGNINNFYRRSEGQLLIDALGDSITVSDVQASGNLEVCGISSGNDSNPHTAILSNLKEISITDFSATNLSVYGLSALVDQYVDREYAENSTAITVKNGTVRNNIKIYGIGQTVNTPAVNNGQITVSDIQKPTGTIMGQYQICGISYQSNDSVLNNGNITIERIAPNDYSMTVVGCCINASSEQSRLVMNSGSIDLKETAPNTYISGVADEVTVGENTGLLLNTGNINVDITSNNILHCGGVTGSSSNERLLNAVNAGDITVIKGVSDETEIYGVGAAGDIQSVVNWGSITVTGLKDHAKNKVYAVGYGKSALCAWLNYGNVTVDLSSPHTALIGAVDFDGSVSDDEIIAGTGINYGTFNAAHRSGKGKNSQWYVDLSGRKEVIPSARWNYSTDPTAKNVMPWCNDRDEEALFHAIYSLPPRGYYTDDTDQGQYYEPDFGYTFSYKEMIKPSFGFIYNNPLATYYKNAAEKQEYNGENIIDYADRSDLRGQTLAYLLEHYPDMAGCFCLNGSSILFDQTAGYLDADVEDCIDHESLPFRNEKISSRWGEKSVNDLFKNDLNQRDTGTTAKLSHYITMESVDEYETKSGSFEKIRNKTSLVPFQAPICGNLDTYITVAKLYAVTNEFKEIDGKTVPFILDVKGSKDITFRYFTDPVIYEDQQDMVRKVLHQFSDITYTGLEIPYSTENEPSVSLPIPESGQAVYALVGLAVSENGKKTNALVIRLEAAGTTPKGWLTSLRYATGIDESQRGYVYESMLTNDEDSYTESNIYESTTNYTVTEAQQITESYGELTYPVYTMTKDMVHSSDGAYNPDGQYDWETNGIHTSSGVMTKFAVKNVDNYLIYVNDGSDYTGFIKGTMPDDHTTASENGIETIKYFGDERINIGYSSEKHLKSGTVDTEATDFPSFSNTYTYYYNPFMRGGEKTITVGTKSVSGEFIILFKMVINKEESNENYIKSKTVKRRDNLTRNEPAEEISKVDIQPKYFKDVYYAKYRADVSTLAKKGTPSPTNIYQDFVNAGETHYPAQVVSTIDVTAENGDTETYSHIYQFEKTEKLLADCIADSHDNVLAYGSNPFVMFDQDMNVDFSVYYRTYRDVSLNYCELYKTLVYVDGVLTDTVGDGWKGLHFYIYNGGVRVYPQSDFTKEELPDGIITIKPVIRLNTDGNTGSNEVFTLELDSFSFTKTLSKEHRALSVSWDKTLVTSAISTTQNDLSGDVDIFGDGSIDYSMTHDETNTFYITNSVKADCTGSEFSVRIPAFAKLQTFNGTDWVTVFTANNGTVYTTSFNYTFADLQRGYHYDFRVVAQAYAEDDPETKNLVSYYYTTITATTRNKDISIEFDSGNETMNLYREILADNGSTAIQIKNMNGDKAVLQQTKLYKGTSAGEMESTFYRLAQGDYAIDVQVPKGYIARVKIVGGSSEGYLNDSDVVKGKRIRLPYANEQSIRLVVYLTKDMAPSSWGVSYEKTLFHAARQNNI